jgi:FMN-dependent oxidoreductase (nitrilotriacetate monooxygenase family)
MRGHKQIALGVIPKETPFSWRYPGAFAEADHDFEHFRFIAQEAERGLLDLIFCADSVALRDDGMGMENVSHTGTAAYFDGMTIISALAAITKHIGIASTASTTYWHPYHLARQLATVDHISKGRAGWNVITSGQTSEALNFGYDAQVDGPIRYERARECLETVFDLWDSWEDDAILRDTASGRFFDPSRVHRLYHDGKHFKVRGPLNVRRPPQGHPVICQAGGSNEGWNLAAEYADVMFSKSTSLSEAQRFYLDIKSRLPRFGRRPDQLKIMLEMRAIVGRTEQEAHEKFRAVQDMVTEGEAKDLLKQFLPGADLTDCAMDEPIPDTPEINAAAKRFRVFVEKDGRRMTLRELTDTGFGSWILIGTPAQIADGLIAWFDNEAADGFMFTPHWLPGGLTDFVDMVVPELQARGVFRTAYEGGTLREIMGFDRPAPRCAAARDCAAE